MFARAIIIVLWFIFTAGERFESARDVEGPSSRISRRSKSGENAQFLEERDYRRVIIQVIVAQRSRKRDRPCARKPVIPAIRNSARRGARRSRKIAKGAREALQGGPRQPRSASYFPTR